MELNLRKIIFSDRYTIIITALIILLATLTCITFFSASKFEKKNKELKTELKEMQILREDFVHIKDFVESKEKKIGLTKTGSAVSTLEQLLNSLGLKAKVMKPLEKKRLKEFTEEDTELEIEGIDLNTTVNLLYRIENSPAPLKVRRATLKTTFENPDVFILSMTASLISKP